jgi:hypothetical protein
MTSCFISHTTSDQEFIEQELLGILQAIGVDIWYFQESIETAAQWEREIRRGLESAEWFLIVLSKNSANSEWVKDELDWAMSNRSQRIVPLLIDDCDSADFHIRLPRIQHIDFRSDIRAAREELIRFFVDATFSPLRRGNLIEGPWQGIVKQTVLPENEEIQYSITMNLRADRDQIIGDVRIEVPEPVRDNESRSFIEFMVTGGLLYDRFVQLTYKARDPRMIQFGSSVFEIDDRGMTMSGPYIGYGTKSRQITTGSIRLLRSTV